MNNYDWFIIFAVSFLVGIGIIQNVIIGELNRRTETQNRFILEQCPPILNTPIDYI
jgi:hypothetical protein